MYSPFRLYSAARTLTTRTTEIKTLNTKKIKPSKKQLEIDNLNEQLILVKQQKNFLIDENKSLKQQIHHFEKQLNKQEKLLTLSKQCKTESKHSEQELQIRMKTEETCSIIAYQKQIKEYEMINKLNQEQIEQLKRDTRKTKLQESQIECKVVREEYDKLKIKYQTLIHQVQFSKKDELLKDNMKISQDLYVCQQNLQDLQLKYKKLQQELHQSESKRFQSERIIQDKDKELQLIQFEYSNPKKTINDLNKQWQIKLENSRMIQIQLEDELRQRQEKINLLEKTLREDKSAFLIKEAFYKREIDSLNIQISQLKETIIHLEKEQMIELTSEDQDSQSEESVRQKAQSFSKQKTQLLSNKRKIQKVSFSEVETIGREIALKFQIAQIPFSRLDTFIYSKSTKGIISLNEINEILKQHPFELSEDQSLLVARYLAEPEQEEWIYYDNQQTNDVAIVISIFKNLVKSFELVNPEKYEQIHQQLRQIFKIHKTKLTDYLALNGEQCDLQFFKKAFDYCDISLTYEQEVYLSIKFYEKYKRIINIKYQEMVDYFK